ncbi:glycosyltransferase family 4 protein [Bradyrhizobium sp. AS23.2]|uniref:glycosyltransferase family 4 protein n=1 Tax=Bradyrhizobium sp. AS23.2 TaxID=1680155 RepID=UPI001161250B|nr:glycosyltransferase family 4 protein [Bradyrhizobium sp. AS23.2]
MDGQFKIEHRPKAKSRGILYHLVEIGYGLRLLISAVRFRADYAVVQSGTTHYFVLMLFSIFSIKVIPVLHNTLWPSGFRPRSILKRLLGHADALFFRYCANATICVSPECARQVKEATGGRTAGILTIVPQFDRTAFSLHPPPSIAVPFRLLFAGRMIREKGVFDLLDMIAILERRRPGLVSLCVCGDGPDLELLRLKCDELGLGRAIDIKGRVEPEILRQLLIESHAAIIPTRSGFEEGLAMTAVEPILLGRPIVTNPVVPALELLRSASVSAKTDDVLSYVEAILSLVDSPAVYERLTLACADLREQFFDHGRSFHAALEKAIPQGEKAED